MYNYYLFLVTLIIASFIPLFVTVGSVVLSLVTVAAMCGFSSCCCFFMFCCCCCCKKKKRKEVNFNVIKRPPVKLDLFSPGNQKELKPPPAILNRLQ